MQSDPLPHLTAEDRDQLLSHATRRVLAPGEVLIEEHDRRRELCIVRKGRVRIERDRDNQTITYAILGVGEVLGEMGLLEDTGASARVVAAEEVEVAVVTEEVITQLIASSPGFGARFYRSLAVAMSRRLRAVNLRLARRSPRPEADRNTATAADPVPSALRMDVSNFRTEMEKLEQSVAQGKLVAEAARRRVKATCDHLMNGLTAHASQAGAEGLGAVFREVFPIFLRSATISACFNRPGGYPADLESLSLMQEHMPLGDGSLGTWVDGWFLDRPLAIGVREGNRLLVELLSEWEALTAHPRVTLVSTVPTGRLLADRADQQSHARITVIDEDELALTHFAGIAGPRAREGLTLLRESFADVVAGRAPVQPAPQHFIAATRLVDFSEDEEVVASLDWMYDHLVQDGAVLLACHRLAHPDRLIVQHLLDWPMRFRSEAALVALIQRSRFDARRAHLRLDPSGGRCFAVLRGGEHPA